MKEPPVKIGDILADKYVVERVLGVGGMGVVVEAVHLDLHEARAIKVMLPEVLEEKDAVERFIREARAASRLKSEYVARVHDVGKLENGLPYIVMEHLEGRDLRRVLKEQGHLSVGDAVHYALQACEALAEAHTAGIIHRDLKPGNLFLTTRADGSPCVKVLDFGISKQLGIDDEEMTKTHALLGSPSYMSPEQMRSSRGVDARTDIWSMGVILYRLLTGELPFKGENVTSLVTLVLQTKPLPPSSIVPELPAEIDAVVLRCLERELADRWASVGELSAALLPFAPSEARASVERIARTLSAARTSSPTRSSPGIPSARTSSPGTTSTGRTSPSRVSARTSSPSFASGSTSSSARANPTPPPLPVLPGPDGATSAGSASTRVSSPDAVPQPSSPASEAPHDGPASGPPSQARPGPGPHQPPSEPPTVAVPKRAAPSVPEITARSAAEGARENTGPTPLRGSNDAWANTSFGSRTVALRRSTLAAAAVGVLVVGGLVSLVVARRVETPAAATTANQETRPVAAPAAPSAQTVAISPTHAAQAGSQAPAERAPDTASAPPEPEPTGAASSPTQPPQAPTAGAPVSAAPPTAKGPLRPVAAKSAKVEAPKPEAPAAPAPAPTAAHRVFGTEN